MTAAPAHGYDVGMLPRRTALLGAALLLPARSRAQAPAASLAAGPQGPEGAELREQVWRIPVPARRDSAETVLLEATLFRPPGPGPFPLVVMSHGQPGSPAQRAQMARPRFITASRLFVEEGFAVLLPTRRGFGASGGPFLGGTGGCERLDLANNAETSANDILAVLRFARAEMPFLAGQRVVLAGQSAGGFGSLAAASRPNTGIAGVVNFAGGLRAGDSGIGGGFCEGWQDKLVETMGVFGARPAARGVPSLWIYAANDTFFGYGLGSRMAEAWRRGGGEARFVEIGASGRDGHGFLEDHMSIGAWGRHVRGFLDELRAAGRV